ncbi:MAG: putative oxidoreductase [Cocleimonas sp.]|jgi:putative oxidoreductase
MTKFLLGFFSFGWLRGLDFLPPLLLRLFLAPLLWVSGSAKLGLFSSTDFIWFNPFTWLNLDNPVFEATVAGLAKIPFVPEALASTLGWSIGLLEVVGAFLLLVGFAVRWVSLPLLALILLTAFVALNGESAVTAINSLLTTHGYTDMSGSSFSKALVYFLMLLTLFFMGAGRFFSVDWFLHRKLDKKIAASRVTTTTSRVATDPKADPFDLDNTTD